MEIEPLLEISEIVSVHLALTPETRGFLDADRIARIGEGALLVHLAPIELLDLEALLRRLREGSLRFVTDHADEMDRRDVEMLSGTETCALYPPIGYCTREAKSTRRERFVADLRSFLGSTR